MMARSSESALGRPSRFHYYTPIMPTIAEIIAAKKSAAIAGTSAAPHPIGTETKTLAGIAYSRNALNPEWVAQGPAPKPPETISEKLAAEAAMNRIDPPGKYQAPEGLILRAGADEGPAQSRGQRTEIRGPQEPEPRNLARTAGEGIDMTPAAADAETATWHAAMSAFETDLVVMRDPAEPEVCWLALRPLRSGLPPILLHRLPWGLMGHPATPRPEGEPF